MMGDIRVPSVRECMYKDIFFRNCVAIVGELGAEKLNGVLKLRCGCGDGPDLPLLGLSKSPKPYPYYKHSQNKSWYAF